MRRLHTTTVLATSMGLIALAVAACGPETDDTDSPAAAGDGGTESAPPARLTSSIDSAMLQAAHRARVHVTGGELTDVSLHAVGSSVDVAGSLSGDTWRQTDPLVPATRYVLEAAAVNADDRGTHRSWWFRTAEPAVTDLPAVSPLAGSEVGVGHPVVVSFDHPVTDKSAVEAGLEVRTSRPVTGAWGWLDDETVAWRPREFWPGQTDVSVRLDLAGTELRPGVWVMEDRRIDFRVGREQVLRITDATHTMTVERAGETIRTMPVSLGKPGFTTRSGVKVIMTRQLEERMTSVETTGPNAYDVVVPYAMRMTTSGEFLHAAPWSEWAQGSQNVSHGCTNVSWDDGIWLYENTLVGDPVVTNGTGRPTETWNGLGGLWNFSWDEWQQRSAGAQS